MLGTLDFQVQSTGLPSSFFKVALCQSHFSNQFSEVVSIQSLVMNLFAFNVCLSLCPVAVVWLSVTCTGVGLKE